MRGSDTDPHLDLERLRLETRGCDARVHFNNAGASLMPAPVADALRAYLTREELEGGYETAAAEAAGLAHFYDSAARLLNCTPLEVAFVENATRAWDMAFYAMRFAPGDRILTAVAEYGSNVIAYLHRARRNGVEIVFVPNDGNGQLDVAALRGLIDERVKLISMSHIPTGGGVVNPATAVGAVAREAGIAYLLDACQSVGQMPIDVQAIGCDMLSATGRKYLRGPRGTGFLYVAEAFVERLDPPFLDQHAATLLSETEYVVRPDARRFENWEQNFAGKLALGVAIDYALAIGLPAIRARVDGLAARLRTLLAGMNRIEVTDEGAERCGLVTFRCLDVDAYAVQAGLAARCISVSVSDGSGTLVSFRRRGIEQVVRASVHYFNTDAEITRFGAALTELVQDA